MSRYVIGHLLPMPFMVALIFFSNTAPGRENAVTLHPHCNEKAKMQYKPYSPFGLLA